ncbi:unnamed protein product [Sympodiomycopsis kandeliae]
MASAAMASNGHSPLRVQVGTFNFNLQGTTVPFPDLQSWLVPTISESRNEYTQTSMSQGREAPDIYAVGFQELLPLHMAFADSEEANDAREHTGREIRRAVRHHAAVTRPDGMYPPGSGPEDYTVIAEVHLVSISLYVFGRNRSKIPERVKEVRTSTASTGFFNILGNKGGVGARIVLSTELPGPNNLETEPSDQVLTFVCAHLAAHDHNLLRRNQDYKTIVSRLAFPSGSVQALPISSNLGQAPDLSRGGDTSKLQEQFEADTKQRTTRKSQAKTGRDAALDDKTYTMYDSHHLFFFGDLNYRIALSGGKNSDSESSLTKYDVQRKVGQSDFNFLTKHDQLTKEHKKGNVLQGLHEYPLNNSLVAPTYKYKPIRNTSDNKEKEKTTSSSAKGNQLSAKRVPGWTDRIFWASSGGNAEKEASGAELFRSIMSYTISDHKPVTLLLTLPRHTSKQDYLTSSNKYQLDPSYALYKTVGHLLDRSVGIIWSLLVALGAGNILIGLSQIVVFFALAVYFLFGRNAGQGDLSYWLGSLNFRP